MDNTRNIDIGLIDDLEKRVREHVLLATPDILLTEVKWVFKLTRALYKIARHQTALSVHDAFGEIGDLSSVVSNQLDEEIRKTLKGE